MQAIWEGGVLLLILPLTFLLLLLMSFIPFPHGCDQDSALRWKWGQRSVRGIAFQHPLFILGIMLASDPHKDIGQLFVKLPQAIYLFLLGQNGRYFSDNICNNQPGHWLCRINWPSSSFMKSFNNYLFHLSMVKSKFVGVITFQHINNKPLSSLRPDIQLHNLVPYVCFIQASLTMHYQGK